MGRHRIPFPVQYLDVPVDPALIRNAEIEASSAKLRALVAPKKKASKSRALSKPTIENAVATADEMRIAKDYRRASALHMVALWAWAHEVTYGVLPSMSNSEWKLASIVAGSLLKKRFDGKAELLGSVLGALLGCLKRSLGPGAHL